MLPFWLGCHEFTPVLIIWQNLVLVLPSLFTHNNTCPDGQAG
jgi:hypothetical protein